MVYERLVEISDDTFSGFKYKVDVDELNDLEGIVNIVVIDLKNKLQKINLQALVRLVDEKNFHIHTHTFRDILLGNDNNVIYICGHC